MIPYGRQDVNQEDIDAVVDVLKSDFLTQGNVVPQFERTVAEKVDSEFSVAFNSGTSALHMACMALDLKPGGLLWTSPITFVASANCGLYCGADVDFVDIDPQTFNMSPKNLEDKLIDAEKAGRIPDVVVPVHMCGHPCDMKEIAGLSESYGFKVVEDACHAIGAFYKGETVGNCAYSDITVFSFHPVKIVTTAEGGVATSNDPMIDGKLKLFRNHGITRDPTQMTKNPDGRWFYQQIALGYNYRMTEMQAALGISQLSRLEYYVSRRNELAKEYDRCLADLPLQTPEIKKDRKSSHHLYVIRLDDGVDRKRVYDHMIGSGVGVNVHYIPVHIQPWYIDRGFSHGDFPVAEDYYSRALTLPLFPTMTDEQFDHVVESLRAAVLQ